MCHFILPCVSEDVLQQLSVTDPCPQESKIIYWANCREPGQFEYAFNWRLTGVRRRWANEGSARHYCTFLEHFCDVPSADLRIPAERPRSYVSLSVTRGRVLKITSRRTLEYGRSRLCRGTFPGQATIESSTFHQVYQSISIFKAGYSF